MIDYKGIQALATILELQSFEEAAKKLHITQSAISQRIKTLESFYGKPLLVRTIPYVPTELGQYLIGHFKQVSLLEDCLEREVKNLSTKPKISIALNRDSLETWFMDLLENAEIFSDVLLEIIAADQEFTLDYLKKGLVTACLSTSATPIVGCNVQFLGNMEYILVASPAFAKKYFPKGVQKKALLNAPALKFDQKDILHERYLEKFYGIQNVNLPFQIIPSVHGFKKCALLGYGYGLLPKIDISNELRIQSLIQLDKKNIWEVPLYWHSWNIPSTFFQKLNNNIINQIKKDSYG